MFWILEGGCQGLSGVMWGLYGEASKCRSLPGVAKDVGAHYIWDASLGNEVFNIRLRRNDMILLHRRNECKLQLILLNFSAIKRSTCKELDSTSLKSVVSLSYLKSIVSLLYLYCAKERTLFR